jgi:hypothetical protein
MTEKYNQQSTFNRLRHGRKAKAAALLAGVTGLAVLAGCASSSAPSGSGKAKAVAVGSRNPDTGPLATQNAPSTAPAPETGATSRANWCKAASAIIENAFVDPNAPTECEVLPPSSTPGFLLIRWTLNSAGVTGYSVDASVNNYPFSEITSGTAKPITTSSGAEVIVVPNSADMYVKMPGNRTGELKVLSGEGGATPLGAQNSLMEAAGIFAVFGDTSIPNLYPAGA